MTTPHMPPGNRMFSSPWVWLGLALLPLCLWTLRRLLLAAIASRCPRCGSKFYATPVCGDRRYERWHCNACDFDWEEHYDDWDPRETP